jgi:hypothetical protein
MTATELKDKIAALSSRIAKQQDPAKKAELRKTMKGLEMKLTEIAKKDIKEGKQELSEAEGKIKSLEKVMAITKDAKVKEKLAAKIQELKDSMKEVKQDMAKEKKKPTTKPKYKKQLPKVLTEIEKLIEANKKLMSKYKGAGVDLDRDAGRPSKPFGFRFKGKHNYRVPTQEQIKRGRKRGTVYFEGRPNRADVYPHRPRKLAKGGVMESFNGLKEDDYVWNALGKKLIVDKVTDEEYFLTSFGQSSASPFGKEKVDNYIKKGEWTLKPPKYAEGGATGANGGEIKWQDAEVGDSANVEEINKTGVIVKTYGRKFHLRFVDGSEKTYDASDLHFIKDVEYAEGGETDSVVDAAQFDSLKKGDKIKVTFGSGISRSNEKELLVKSKTLVGKGKSFEAEKITFVNTANPDGVKYYAYKRKSGHVGFAMGDMAIHSVKIVDKYANGGEISKGDEGMFEGGEVKVIKKTKHTVTYKYLDEQGNMVGEPLKTTLKNFSAFAKFPK